MKRVAPIIFFLIILAFCFPGHSQASFRFFVGQEEVELKQPLEMINGNFMIPLWVFHTYLGAETTFSSATGEISLVFPDQTILMQVGVESAQVDDRSYKLEVAPIESEGEVLLPVRFIANRRRLSLVYVEELNGLRLDSPSTRRLNVPSSLAGVLGPKVPSEEQPKSEPLVLYEPDGAQDLQEIIFMEGPRARVFLDLKAYTGYQTILLQNPDRLVVDLFGVSGDALPPVLVNDPVVSSIRSSRFDDETMRIVCDLKGATGYQINPWPDGGLEIEFNYLLRSLGVEEKDGLTQIWFEASGAPDLELIFLENPKRLVLDFQNTTWMPPAFDRPIEHERIARLRVSQHLPTVARVVLELEQPLTPLQLESPSTGWYVLPLFAGTAGPAKTYLASLNLGPTAPPIAPDQPVIEGVLSGLTVAIDPGHGGSDPGTLGFQGTFEKDVVLAIGRYLGEFLTQAGAQVVYTRSTDTYVSIFERPEIAKQAGAHLFISIHANSTIQRGAARGTETLYRAHDPVSQALARTIQDEVVKVITLADRRIWGRDDLAVFNGSKIPAIMVEVGFLDHPDEEVLLRAPGFQQAAAQGIYNGIERFYLESKK